MAKTETIQTIEQWVLDGKPYNAGLKTIAASIREHNRLARDAALVEEEFAKQTTAATATTDAAARALADARAMMGTFTKATDDAAEAAKKKEMRFRDLFRTYKDISQGVRDVWNVFKKFNAWLDESSPEWKELSERLDDATKDLGRQVGQVDALKGAYGSLSEAVQGFQFWLFKTPYDKARGELHDLRIEAAKLADELEAARAAGGFGGGFVGLRKEATLRDKRRRIAELEGVVAKGGPSAMGDIGAGRSRRLMEEWWKGEGIGTDEGSGNPRKRGGGLGSVSWDNQGVLSAGESVIAGEVKEAARQEAIQKNLPLIDAEIAANQRWAESEVAKQDVLAGTISRLREVQQEVQFAANSNAQYMRTWAEGFSDVSMGVGEFTAGLWSAADAAITSGESFGAAVLKQVKAELMGVAARSTIAALYFTGMGFASLAGFNPVSASQYFTAAGIMAAVAAAAGAGALGIASATSSRGASGGSARSGGYTDRSVGSFSDSQREKEKEINVYVYLGDKYDRSAQLYMRRSAEGMAA